IVILQLAENAPRMLRQPEDQTGIFGTDVALTVTIGGSAPLYLHWNRNGMPISDGGGLSGTTSTNLTIAGVNALIAGAYSVVATNQYGAVTSRVAQLTVVGPTLISRTEGSGIVHVSFQTVAGRRYTLEKKVRLSDS